MQSRPESEDWKRIVPAAETKVPWSSETASAQSRPGSPPIHRETSPDHVRSNILRIKTLLKHVAPMPAFYLQLLVTNNVTIAGILLLLVVSFTLFSTRHIIFCHKNLSIITHSQMYARNFIEALTWALNTDNNTMQIRRISTQNTT